MYVCICNALTERRVEQVIREHRPQTVDQVYALCQVQPQCRRCSDTIAAMMDEVLVPA